MYNPYEPQGSQSPHYPATPNYSPYVLPASVQSSSLIPSKRPGVATAGAVLLIVGSVLMLGIGSILLFFVVSDPVGFPDDEVTALYIVGGGLVAVFALGIVSGALVLWGARWARVTGIVVASLAMPFSVAGLSVGYGWIILPLFVLAIVFLSLKRTGDYGRYREAARSARMAYGQPSTGSGGYSTYLSALARHHWVLVLVGSWR